MSPESDLEGEFLCPTCGKVSACALRKVSDMLTQYAAPLWDSDLGSYVECIECGDAFHPSVLNSAGPQTDADHAAFRTLMIGIMVSMMDIDGAVHPSELEAISSIYSELAGGPVPRPVLQRGIEMARVAGSSGAIDLAKAYNHRLNQLSRELVFRAALYVSAADRAIRQVEMDFLKSVGTSLGLDESHMGAIIQHAREAGHIVLGASD